MTNIRITMVALVLAALGACGNDTTETASGGAGSGATPSRGTAPPVAAAPATTQPGACESAGATAEIEGNDQSTNATRVGGGQAVTGAISRNDDADWFVIETCGEKLLRVQLTNAPATRSAVDYEIHVFEADAETTMGHEQHGDGSDGTTMFDRLYYVEAAQRVYVRINDIYRDDADAAAPYRLTLTPQPVPDADLEPNGNKNPDTCRALASALTAGQPGTGFIASLGDEDYWKIDVPGETLLRVELTNAPATRSEVDYELFVFPPAGEDPMDNQQFSDGASGIAQLTTILYAGQAGTYYVRVHDQYDDDYDPTQPYRITVTLVPVPDGDHEPNGNQNDDTNRALATPLTAGQPATGYIASRADEDWYKIDMPAGGTLTVDLATTATNSPVDYRVRIFGADEEPLAQGQDDDGSDGMTRLRVEAQVPAAGTYYVAVNDAYDDEIDGQNPYTITVAR